jgi:guanylate kinase
MELSNTLLEKVKTYAPQAQKLEPYRQTPLLFAVGISGAGKNTIMEVLLSRFASEYHSFVTHTTRAPRKNHGVLEQNHVDYHFIDFATSERMLDNHDYIEVNNYSGNIYGTSVSEIEEAHREHKIVIADIDVNGVANFVHLGMNVKPVFIIPPSYAVWQSRVHARNSNATDLEDWQRRMRTARNEIIHALESDYFYFVVNDDLEEATAVINAIAHEDPTIEHRPPRAIQAAQDILAGIDTALLQR